MCLNRCSQGFVSGNDGCVDVNECKDQPCHPSAECVNLHGSYRCACPLGTVGDPLETGCVLPHQCNENHDCPESQACISHNCTDPCSLVDCGQSAFCTALDHNAACQCQPGYIGDATGCIKVECLNNNDCSNDKYCNLEINKCYSECNFYYYK